ncbi:MAG: flippase [Candidatus Bathyarchaeota archaeon]|nr:flippase [Candidatus Bathyarchaeum tardum]
MDKALKMGKISATGSFQLFFGKVVSSILLAFGSIILARVMLPAEYGIYSIALIPPMTFGLFSDWGINQAITKFSSNYKALGKTENISDIIISGLIFKVTIGLLLSFSALFFANFIATTIYNRPETSVLISIASLAILSESLLDVAQSSFIGYERMELTSYTLISQAFLKSLIGPLLVLVGYGTIGAVVGYSLSFIISALLGIALLYFQLVKNLKKTSFNLKDKIKTLKKMLSYGLPLSLSSILTSFLYQFYAFLMAFHVTDAMIGNYQIAINFSVFISFFTYPLGTVLFPAFSKLDPKKEIQLLKTVFSSAVKYAALLLVPATMVTIVLAGPVIGTVYGQKWIEAPFFLSLYVLQNFFVLTGGMVINIFLQGVGETKFLLKLSIIRLLLGIPLAFFLIPTYGITGVIFGTFFAELPTQVLGIYWMQKKYDAKPEYKTSAKILISSSVTALVTYFAINNLILADWLRLIIGGSIFLIVYLIIIPVIGAVKQNDIQTLKAMFSNLGVLSKIINVILLIAEKVTLFRK